jgi:copper chaperone CopZ
MKLKFIYPIVLILCTIFSSNLQAQSNDTTITVKVKGITCSSDLKTIKTNIEKLEGVSECNIGKPGATSKFKIQFNPQLLTEKAIYKAIEGTGGCENPEDRPYKVKQ